jgi:leucyl aminopeptidase
MDISFASRGNIGPGALVVGILDGGGLTAAAAAADEATGGAVKRALSVSRFKGQAGQSLELLAPAGVKASRIVLAGLGKTEAFNAAAAERLAATVLGRLLVGGEETLTFAIDLPKRSKLREAELAAHLALGASLRSYRFDQYRKVGEDETITVKKIVVSTREAANARRAWAGLSAVGEGIFLARDLVNEPANILYPDEFAKRTQALRKLGVKVEVLDVPAMKKLGMNALLGVGQGSRRDSRVVIMRWNGGKKSEAPVAFIGKGVCFDTGGISIKPAAGMSDMKWDMAGSAVVIGLMRLLAARKAKVNAVGVVGLVENMPSGTAQRPGDIENAYYEIALPQVKLGVLALEWALGQGSPVAVGGDSAGANLAAAAPTGLSYKVDAVTLTTVSQTIQVNGAYNADIAHNLDLVVSTAAPGAGGPAVGTPITTTINFTATAN